MIEKKKKGRTRQRLPVDEYDGRIYKIGLWKGLKNYECLFCSFATVNHETALEHAVGMHSPPEEQAPEIIDTGIVGEDGDPITRAVKPAKED